MLERILCRGVVKESRPQTLQLPSVLILYGGAGSWGSVFCFLLFKTFSMEKINIYKPHEDEKLVYRKWIAPRYYDHPDGEDLLGKLNFTTKVAFFASSILGIFYTTTYPAPPTVKGKLLRYSKIVLPAVGMAATFTCVTYYATNFRKKDDQLNYAIGGAAAGLILAPSLGHPYWVFWGPLFCAVVGMMKKDCQMKGTTLIPQVKKRHFSSYYLRNDTSLLTDPIGGNWTKEPAK